MATEYIVGPGETYTTISAAITAAEAAGATDQRIVRVKSAGSPYVENITLGAVSWTALYYFSLESFSGARDVSVEPTSGAWTMNMNSTPWVRVKAMRFKGTTSNGQIVFGGVSNRFENIETDGQSYGLWQPSNASIAILDSEFHNHSIYGVGNLSFGTTLENCYIHDNTGGGLHFAEGRGTRVEGCTIINSGVDGVLNATAYDRNSYRNCTIAGNTGDGIKMSGGAGHQIELVNCILKSNGGYGINFVNAPSGIRPAIASSDGNCFFGNTSGLGYDGASALTTLLAWQTWTRAQTGRTTEDDYSIAVDPKLQSDGTLQSDSPCINAGVGRGSPMRRGGLAWVDAHHPAIGSDGQWDQELDLAPPPFLGTAPTFAADSRLDQDTVTVSPAEATAFPASNLYDDRVFTVFKPGSTATTVDIKTDAGVGQTADVDYFGLVGHDLYDPASDGNGPVTLTLASSADDITYTPIFSAPAADNRIIFRAFTRVTARYFRLRLTRVATFVPSLGELQWGQRVDVPAGIETGFDPEEERVNARVARSQSGELLGSITTFSARRATIRLRFVPDSFMRGSTVGNFGEFWRNEASLLKPFFFAWHPGDPGSFEKDTFFGVLDAEAGIRRSLATQLASGLRNLDLSVVGLRE